MINTPVKLPNGSQLSNRIVKAAMEEDLAQYGQPDGKYVTLYRRWADGLPGLLITGNVVVDKTAPTDAGVVVLEDDKNLSAFSQWAQAAQVHNNKVIMQINHPGRQIPNQLCSQPVAPSAVGVNVPGGRGLFNTPRALTEDEIEDIIQRFVTTSTLAIKAGFDGVQIHAAHGYLINQFLSPLTNLRKDQWGGSLDNRARFLLEIVNRVRQAVGKKSILSIKLNSADFQKGGFSEQECESVIEMLNHCQLDLLEISGGNYEVPTMLGHKSSVREAFFLEFAAKAKQLAKMPVMVTGGFRSANSIQKALESEAVDLVGLGKPFCVEPDLPKKLIDGSFKSVDWPVKSLKNQAFNSLAQMGWAHAQIHRLAVGQSVNLKLGTIRNLITSIISVQIKNIKYRRWLS